MSKKVLMIIGSLRKDSFNKQLAQKAAVLLQDKNMEVSFLEYGDLPFMNQDIEYPAPEAVSRVRKEVGQADGVWFFSPEYNFSYSGVLKNLLDWLSRALDPNDYMKGSYISDKKAAISGAAGRSGAAGSRARLRELLKVLRVRLLDEEVGIALSGESFQSGSLVLSEEDNIILAKQVDAFVKFLDEQDIEK